MPSNPLDRLPSSLQFDVTYSCGSCGYVLNLNSGNRNIANIDSTYKKYMKKGTMHFFSIDESRFSQSEELRCMPYISRSSFGLFRRRTRLLCRKCGNHIGVAYDGDGDRDAVGFSSGQSDNNPDYISGNGSYSRKYSIKISALQPSEEPNTLLLT